MASRWASVCCVVWLVNLLLLRSGLASGQGVDLFRELTRHIEQSIQLDKEAFVDAQLCTEWFYQQWLSLRGLKPLTVTAVKQAGRTGRRLGPPDCLARYPGGLEAARQDFSTKQSILAVSLTFYEFVLVGDRNDDGSYTTRELQDVLESLDLRYDRRRPDSSHLTLLTRTFDALHRSGEMERLIASIATLLDKGYRFTSQDRAALDRLTQQ
jgi:hypothetical protein